MENINKPTLVIGASTNPQRYSYLAVQRLTNAGHDIYALGLDEGKIGSVPIHTEWPKNREFDTVTLYINRKIQPAYYKKIINLQPARVIFNPGTENTEFYELLDEYEIPYEQACSLVLLNIGQY